MDSDLGIILNEDDTIGTHFFSLYQISSTSLGGNGFLPTFGPAYVNLYGSMREFEYVAGEHSERLNLGIGEGCAYRGRVLIEITSQPGGYPPEPRLDLPEHELDRLAVFQRRRGYKLRVELIDLNMISSKVRGGPIEVEVSMGNYGNCHETEVAPGSSMTLPHQAVSDGSNYWYISWEDKKPVLELDTEWEDVEYR